MTSMSHANSTTPVPFPKRRRGVRIRLALCRLALSILRLCHPDPEAEQFGRYDDGVDSDDELGPSGGGDWHEVRVRPVRGRGVRNSCELYRRKSVRRETSAPRPGIDRDEEREGHWGGRHVDFEEIRAAGMPSSRSHHGTQPRLLAQDVAAFVLMQEASAVKSHWSSTTASSKSTVGANTPPKPTAPAPAAPSSPQQPKLFATKEQLHDQRQSPVSSAPHPARPRFQHPQAPLRPHLSPAQRVAPQSRVNERLRRSSQSERARQVCTTRVTAGLVAMNDASNENEKGQDETETALQEQAQDPLPRPSSDVQTGITVMWRTPVGEGEEMEMMREMMGEIAITGSSSSDEESLKANKEKTTNGAEQQDGNRNDERDEPSNWEQLSSRSTTTPATPSDQAMQPLPPRFPPPPPHPRRLEPSKLASASPSTQLPAPRPLFIRSPRKVLASPRSDDEEYDTPVLRSIAFKQLPDGKDVLSHIDAGYAAYLGCQMEPRKNMTLFGVEGPRVHWGMCARREGELMEMAEAAQVIMRRDGEGTTSRSPKRSASFVKEEKKKAGCGIQ